MNDRLEQILIQQLHLITKLQTKTDEILSWNTSTESAEATAAYFQALESAVDGLGSLSEVYEYFEDWSLAEDEVAEVISP
ncbi:MAG: hypothetical protein N4J56_001538 [Chroococcidiopsis sp. SAG 2025]|uniref:hypothetical protein n=1 Tax=Chroococcidiopsis sp. SAG 2025 TaxID=171389 RepID=UPI002936DAD5|nr:hypothetical protein [Chroococcidiopsis sp. SAG 2025]MDV2991884.1 hypothetical protein [Chroococcidiopsis sp. SAG 2025]